MSSTQTDESWIDEFILALRLRDVRGDAVAVVRGHIADSGQNADAAFGDPGFYAKQLDLPRQSNLRPGTPGVMGVAVSLMGLLVFSQAIPALFAGTHMEVSLPQLLLFAIPCAVVLALPYYFNLGLRHLWVFAVAFFVAIAAGIGAGLFDGERRFPTFVALDSLWVSLGAGTAILAASAWSIVEDLRSTPDPLLNRTDPNPAPAGLISRLIGVIPNLLMPLIAVPYVFSVLQAI